MNNERFVVLGLAHVRSPWFREVSRWATTAVVPLDFVKCVSVDELRVRLRSGRSFSAVVADAGVAGIDRDLVHLAREIGCAVILVDDGATQRDLGALGISAVLPAAFDRVLLLGALADHAAPIGAAVPDSLAPLGPDADFSPITSWRGRIVAVVGAGGTGKSVTAMALAQGLAHDVRSQGRVLLADLALDADQAMMHYARDIVPGVQELVEAFRHGNPSPGEIRNLTFGDGYPYRLLLGLRRHRDWTALRPRAWHAALDGLRRTFTQIVADTDGDVEGESQCGSLDVEERNLLTRSVVSLADVVVVTAIPGVQGIHRLVRHVADLAEHGIEPPRLLPVISRAPRSGRAKSELSRTVAALNQQVMGPAAAEELCSPMFVPELRRLDQSLRDGTGVPPSMAAALAAAVRAVMIRHDAVARQGPSPEPVPVMPGSLGSWADDGEAAR